MYKLSEIGAIRSGKLFKNGVIDDKSGISVIQIRDVTRGEGINWNTVAKVKLDKEPQHQLKNGDVLLLSKGIENHAIAMTEVENPTISTAHFFYIRPTSKVRADFLALQLNSSIAKDYFRGCFKEGRKKHITKADLLELEVHIPDVSTQRKIVELSQLLSEQNRLLEELKDTNAKTLEALFKQTDDTEMINSYRLGVLQELTTNMVQSENINSLVKLLGIKEQITVKKPRKGIKL